MLGVVHEFVSETQKGFVPDVLIADATMLLRLVEACINEEPEERKGTFLFLDMEKYFDRVSYEFTKKGLDAYGFGTRFQKWVGTMYNEEKAPRRRMYVNGYYSEWFPILSGVAQGCPLSPPLFLIAAEAMQVAIDLEKGLKGIARTCSTISNIYKRTTTRVAPRPRARGTVSTLTQSSRITHHAVTWTQYEHDSPYFPTDPHARDCVRW
jgi:hypothetical protein